MPPINPVTVAALAAIAGILVQTFKGVIPEAGKKWIPTGLMVIMTPIGALLALYIGGDPVGGALEGFFAFASSVGFYEFGSSVVPGVINGRGWLQLK